MLSASSSTNTFTSDTSTTLRRIRSVIVPGVPTMMCAVTFFASFGRLSLIAYSVWIAVNLPIAFTTDMICRASSRDGARQSACAARRAGVWVKVWAARGTDVPGVC